MSLLIVLLSSVPDTGGKGGRGYWHCYQFVVLVVAWHQFLVLDTSWHCCRMVLLISTIVDGSVAGDKLLWISVAD